MEDVDQLLSHLLARCMAPKPCYRVAMTQKELQRKDPVERVAWLTEMSPTQVWLDGEDVFCLHCDGVWKAEDVACDKDGYPTCPVCKDGTPIDFHPMPWWREDLVKERNSVIAPYKWIGKPVKAEPGKPSTLPPGPKK